MDLREKTMSTDYKFRGEIINLRVDTVTTPSGNVATRELVEHPGGVAIVALTEDHCVLMERQYRHPFDTVTFEIPAGKLNYGEDPLECGKRELEEETGCRARIWTPMSFMYPTPGFCCEILHMFLARDLYTGTVHRDQDELMEVEKVPIAEVVNQIMNGTVHDAKTCLAIMKVHEMMRRGEL